MLAVDDIIRSHFAFPSSPSFANWPSPVASFGLFYLHAIFRQFINRINRKRPCSSHHLRYWITTQFLCQISRLVNRVIANKDSVNWSTKSYASLIRSNNSLPPTRQKDPAIPRPNRSSLLIRMHPSGIGVWVISHKLIQLSHRHTSRLFQSIPIPSLIIYPINADKLILTKLRCNIVFILR